MATLAAITKVEINSAAEGFRLIRELVLRADMPVEHFEKNDASKIGFSMMELLFKLMREVTTLRYCHNCHISPASSEMSD
ncbi:MAG: hypothetical protein WA056_06740 [Gallionella sp.]